MDRTAPSFLTFAALAIFITAIAILVGMSWSSKACATESFTYMGSLAKKISPEETTAVMKETTVELQPPVIPSAPPVTVNASALEEITQATTGSAPTEGFYAGPAVGAGVPDCMRSSKEAAALYEMLNVRKIQTEEGPDDLRELGLILSKIGCFKRDLTGAAGVVAATRTQPFSTAHDLEPVAETTARCFAKTISQRDLSLGLDKWGSRGTFLIKRLCTALDLSDAEEKEALRLFGEAMADISDVALGACCNGGEAKIAGIVQPRMVGGYEPEELGTLRPYNGYY